MSPAQPWRKMHSAPATAASTVSRSGPGKSGFQSRLSPPISVGWQAKLATTAMDSPFSPSTPSTGTVSSIGRSRRTLLTLIPGARPVPQPTRAGFWSRQAAYTAPASTSGSHSTQGANEPVSASPATVEPRDTLGALWLCAALTSTPSGEIPVSRCTRSRIAAVMSAPAKTRSTATIASWVLPSSRTSACPIIGSRMPSARPVRADQHPCGRPDGGVTSTRATPAVKLMDDPFSRLDDQLVVGAGDVGAVAVGRGDGADDTDDPAGLRVDGLRLPVDPLQEVDSADGLARLDLLAEVDEGLEETRLGRGNVVLRLGCHQELRRRLPPDGLARERTEVPEHVREPGRCEPVDFRRDVPAAPELRAHDDLSLPLGFAHEEAGAADVDVDAAPLGVPREHPVDHLPPLGRVVDPVHLGPGEVERVAPAAVDVDDHVRDRKELGREEVRELLVGRAGRRARERAVQVRARRPEARVRPGGLRRGARDHDHAARDLLGLQRPREVQRRDLALRLVAVHAADHESGRSRAVRDGDDRDHQT